ncbi:Cof-type HAD-IIB family hydrolase [Leptospira semungkisensis]|uniref:Cof-type HAD-IIB family hydrolase n=1 Tax=Leptospira semungkisensis TaxID=2484985 RepID=A0A4R9FYT0_9LEPT|nr:Cof-type HAD-IIB family hydrolase [Leptospira semungkisensis]TGK04041.1 Cof-type HAD-IIB family hydrolase [Leptospira semungkisensis]
MDLDGTLLDSKASISSLNHYVLQSALDLGIGLIIATGRRFSSALPYAREFRGDVVVVANNGQVLRSSPSGDRISETYLSAQAAGAVLSLGKSEGFSPLLHVDRFEEGTDILVESPITEPCFHNYSGGDMRRTRVVSDTLDHAEDKALVVCYLSLMKEHLQDLETKLLALPEAKEYRTVITKIPGVSYCLEVLEKGVSKWAAIESYLKASGLEETGVISFGDEWNDREMLKHSGYGFAMKNAVPKLKEEAEYITKYSNNEDGIAMTLLELGVLSFA